MGFGNKEKDSPIIRRSVFLGRTEGSVNGRPVTKITNVYVSHVGNRRFVDMQYFGGEMPSFQLPTGATIELRVERN